MRRRLHIVLGLWLLGAGGGAAHAAAQPGTGPQVTELQLADPGLIRQAIYHREILEDPNCGQTLGTALASTWQPTRSNQWPDALNGCHWLRERVWLAGAPRDLVVGTGYHSFSDLYVLLGDSLVAHYAMGNELPLSERANPSIWVSAYRNTAPLALDPDSVYMLVYRARNPYGANIFGKNAPLRLSFYGGSALAEAGEFHQKASYALAGSLLMLLLYHVLQLFVYRSGINAVFCGLLASLLVYISYENFLFHDLFRGEVFRESVLIVSGELCHVLLFLLTRVIFAEKAPGTKAILLLDVLMGAKFLEMVLWFGLFQARYAGYEQLTPWLTLMPDVFRLSTITCLLVYFGTVAWLAFRIRGWATRAILIGNAALTLSVIVYVVQAFLHDWADYAVVQLFMRLVDPLLNYCVEIGIVLMSLCFSLSVAILTKERERSIEQRYVRQLADTEMSALRAQMNPHFLFNGLNSIKRFVIQNEPAEAGVYLSKFAGLIRLVLENSKSSLIPLERELETLNLYMEMERLRFETQFTYAITVAEGIAPKEVDVPPTLLQPYVENAIWHGLLHRPLPGGHVGVRIEADGSQGYRFVVEDNGVGRAAAAEMRSRSATTRKSLGLKITADRLRLLHERYGLNTSVSIEDLFEGGAAAGTRVTITLQKIVRDSPVRLRGATYSSQT